MGYIGIVKINNLPHSLTSSLVLNKKVWMYLFFSFKFLLLFISGNSLLCAHIKQNSLITKKWFVLLFKSNTKTAPKYLVQMTESDKQKPTDASLPKLTNLKPCRKLITWIFKEWFELISHLYVAFREDVRNGPCHASY